MANKPLIDSLWAILSLIALGSTFLYLLTVTFPAFARIRIFNTSEYRINLPLVFCFVVSAAALTGSLLYSELFLLEPCKLCWFERVLIYPQVLLLGILLVSKNRALIFSSLVLALSAFGLSVYHLTLQYGWVQSQSCGVASLSCSITYVKEFGFITIPFMVFATSTIIALLSSSVLINLRKSDRKVL